MRPRAGCLATALLVALAGPAGAQPRPPITHEQALENLRKPDVEARRQAAGWLGELGSMADAPVLIRALRDPDEVVRALAENSVWQVWSRSGDSEADALLQLGIEQMNQRDARAAIETFTRVIERKPDFAEGWNKRATVYFLIGEYARSLRDCDEVIKRNPDHFGALAGYGQIYLELDKPERALEYFQRALAVNPNLHGVEVTVEHLKRLLIERRRGTV
ncbi:MAG TPA: tetratricopeptide repeat protein [Methylomirabilota bacterium]|nr:tetratricopeptide repeat protein [Methylomirabilota bacterium]